MDEWVIEAETEYCISYGFFDVKEDLIRCKDCKHSRTSPISAKVWDPDNDFMACRFHGRMVVEDDFCSWGEREEK